MELRGGLHGGPWGSVEASMELRGSLHGGPWSPVEVSIEVRGGLHGGPWRSVGGGLYGGPWRSVEVRGAPWRSPWRSVEAPWRSPWRSVEVSMGVYGGPWGSPWRSVEVRGGPWRSKLFNRLYLLFFKGFHGFYFIFAHSNLDILFKTYLGRCYFNLVPTYDFGYAQKVHLSTCSARVTRQNS